MLHENVNIMIRNLSLPHAARVPEFGSVKEKYTTVLKDTHFDSQYISTDGVCKANLRLKNIQAKFSDLLKIG